MGSPEVQCYWAVLVLSRDALLHSWGSILNTPDILLAHGHIESAVLGIYSQYP